MNIRLAMFIQSLSFWGAPRFLMPVCGPVGVKGRSCLIASPRGTLEREGGLNNIQ